VRTMPGLLELDSGFVQWRLHSHDLPSPSAVEKDGNGQGARAAETGRLAPPASGGSGQDCAEERLPAVQTSQSISARQSNPLSPLSLPSPFEFPDTGKACLRPPRFVVATDDAQPSLSSTIPSASSSTSALHLSLRQAKMAPAACS
jgi:hypothetical protein